MNALVTIEAASLPVMIDRAAAALTNARGSAEVLEARDMAAVVYDVAKRTARLAKAKDAHDSLIAAAHRAQADAREIEAAAKRRLADEYDAAQERGEVASHGGGRNFKVPDGNVEPATVADIGLTRKDIHEARQFRDAETNDPGVTKRTLTELLDAGHELTKAVRRSSAQRDIQARWARVLPPPRSPRPRALRSPRQGTTGQRGGAFGAF